MNVRIRRLGGRFTSPHDDFLQQTGRPMQADFRRMSLRTDDEMRTIRLARGLRAVAATMIVGGIVIAAIDTAPTAEHEMSRVELAEPATNLANGAPLSSAEPSAPGSRESEPVLERIERSMEHH